MVFGFPLQDIAISFYYLRSREDYTELTDSFLTGYTRERKLPTFNERGLHLLWMARMANFVNYVAHMDEAEDAKPFIESRCLELDAFLAQVS